MNKLFPNVSLLRTFQGFIEFKSGLKIAISDTKNDFFGVEKVNAFIKNKSLWNEMLDFELISNKEDANIIYEFDSTLEDEAYRIKTEDNILIIYYSSASGAYYATKTLEKIIVENKNSNNSFKINNLEIFDKPATKVRGIMLDISRDKVATIVTIKQVIDLMTNLKMNHLELYVEGFSFEYQSFPEFLEEDGYITVKEYQELEKYANDRFIDLVPNQNGFGHMAKWLETEKFKNLAVCPDGMMMWGRWRNPNTLDPLNPGSIELVKKLYKDMLPFSNSKYFNMNFDEPFELGHGNTEGQNVGNLYLDYMLKAYEEVKKYKKIPLIWGDVLLKHPESLVKLPKDMIFLDWGYDAKYPFRKHAKDLSKNGIKFICAPGTTSWCSFFGRYIDWYENIKNAVDAVREFNGEGVILTDWGDFGHLQFLSSSYAPIVYMGLYSWSGQEGCILDVREYLNKYIFRDQNDVIGDLLIDLSNYYRYDTEYCGNGTKTFYAFMWAVCSINDAKDKGLDAVAYYKQHMGNSYMTYPKFKLMRKFLNSKLEELEYIDSRNETEVDLVKREIVQSIKLLKMIHKVSIAYNEEVDLHKRIQYLEEVVASKDSFLEEQKNLWLTRNKSGGLKSSLSYLDCFMSFANETLNYLSRMGELK